jgi:HEAT repeat protein
MTSYTGAHIIELLETPVADLWPGAAQIGEHADTVALVTALTTAGNPHTREVLCNILAERCDPAATPALAHCLTDSAHNVRNSAAEALGKSGDPASGRALYACFTDPETPPRLRPMIAAGLGAVGHRPAIPQLIEALRDVSEVLRGDAAWALGLLPASEAVEPLRQALAVEQRPFNRELMTESLHALEQVVAALEDATRPAVLPALIADLQEVLSARRGAAAWALGQIKAREAAPALEQALARERYCPVAHRMREALTAIGEGR